MTTENKPPVDDDFEVHVFATTDEEGYSDGLETEAAETPEEDIIPKAPRKRRGLIRIVIVALLILVNGYFIHLLWGEQIARYYLDQEAPEEQFAAIDPVLYDEIVGGWRIARGNLRTAEQTKTDAEQEIRAAQAQITTMEQSFVQSGDKIAKIVTQLEGTDAAQTTAAERVAELATTSLKEDLEASNAALTSAAGTLDAAQAAFVAAKNNTQYIERTVEQLERASLAAVAAMEASEAAQAAATSAGNLISETEGSENPSLLARLTFNIFSETQSQVSGAERAQDAAAKALATGESQLAEASDTEADTEAALASAKGAARSALAEKERLQKEYAQLLLDRKVADDTFETAQSTHKSALSALDVAEADSKRIAGNLSSTANSISAAQARIGVTEGDIQNALERFETADADLSAARTKRAMRSAVLLTHANALFSKRLMAEFGVPITADPGSDRFGFSSEILFKSGASELGAAGKSEIDRMALILKDVAETIPADVPWVLRVDGHTDNKPFASAGVQRDNWQLSQARALAVVKHLVDTSGVSPSHLAANGFGQYQPISTGTSTSHLALNRRIELFITPK